MLLSFRFMPPIVGNCNRRSYRRNGLRHALEVCGLRSAAKQKSEGTIDHREETFMPFVNVKIIEGVFSDSQKQDIVRKLTDAMVTIEGENMRQVTWVVVEEVKSGDWGIGGQPLTTGDVKALAAAVR